MQSATGQNKSTGAAGKPEKARPIVQKKLLPITKILAAAFAIASLGLMAVVLLGIWPPKETPRGPSFMGPTPQAILQSGLKVEALGNPIVDPNDKTQVVITLTVSNNLRIALARVGTPTPGVAAPTAGPVKVCSVDLRVAYYRKNAQGMRELAGVGYTSVANIEPGQQRVSSPVYARDVGDPQNLEYEIIPDNLWADNECKATVATPAARLEQSALTAKSP